MLLEYGYPVTETEAALRQSKARNGLHRVRIGAYWIEHMLGDLAHSCREIRNRRLLEELDELYSVLEGALQGHDGEE